MPIMLAILLFKNDLPYDLPCAASSVGQPHQRGVGLSLASSAHGRRPSGCV